MHGELHLLNIIFRLTIFSLLVYKLATIIKKNVYPLLLNQISLEKNQQTEILEKDKLLISTRHRIENQIFNQKKMLTFLEKNVQVWHLAQIEAAQQKERDNKSVVEKIQEKRIVQQQNIVLDRSIHYAVPIAVQQARSQLESNYRSSAGDESLMHLIEQLGSKSLKTR